MIRIEKIRKSFGDRTIIDDLSIEFGPHEVTAIVGSSGAGKSTLLRCLDFLERPDSGRVIIGDLTVDAERASTREILELRRRTAMVFQQFHLFSRKTALENVAEGLAVVRGRSRREAERESRQYLDRVGLSAHVHQYPSQLSGGQQQRVGIARALAMEPEVLLLDEPTSALDPELVGEVLATIRSIAAEGQAMVLVSHEMNFVRQVSDRVVFLEGGRVLDDSAPETFFGPDSSERALAFLREYRLAFGGPEYQI
ncbi:amino acid ABC transporter ATP-binding protein [Leucobacter triazinivorans]|uniref:Amino acid ABC transporter ATP-binding protein n=1 Tax=Leucobacter triazinivorans TaxID=1784719 RepID=A0A4P6KDN9_9MICO|nr:amino acid ABC transporter ATP-binding protein [Leucobacter triazinivorans]QBE48437.1 amino acid ABC transporter ATP-binding protein [Leucobacter triazinivorans]